MKTVLLVGDSIREHYEARVAALLGDGYRVLTTGENGRFTAYTLWSMWAWMNSLGNPQVDVIHWNNGIWDLHRATADGEVFTSAEDYRRDNERLYTQMRSYTDKLIWATITPGGPTLDNNFAHDPLHYDDPPAMIKRTLTRPQAEWNEMICRYNAIGREVYESRGVVIDDLYSVLASDTVRYLSADGVHPSPDGVEVLAQQVAATIRRVLED